MVCVDHGEIQLHLDLTPSTLLTLRDAPSFLPSKVAFFADLGAAKRDLRSTLNDLTARIPKYH